VFSFVIRGPIFDPSYSSIDSTEQSVSPQRTAAIIATVVGRDEAEEEGKQPLGTHWRAAFGLMDVSESPIAIV